jgi:DNA-binding GntR family transcriptional regulator
MGANQDSKDSLDGQKIYKGRKVMKEYIKEYLVAMIMRGDYKAGDRLVETRLAQNLGVSQEAVREALRDLEWLGFLQTEAYGEARVRDLTLVDYQEIFPVRAVLEGLGARMAAPRLTDADLEVLDRLVEEMIRFSQANDQRSMGERNYTFHLRIMEASGNQTLVRTWSMFQFSYWITAASIKLQSKLEQMARRHISILEILKTRDPEAAERAISEHVLGLLEELSNNSEK